jgi:hypothetical protein
MLPKTPLSTKPPARLMGHVAAMETWTRLIKLYQSTKGTMIVCAFDEDVLCTYSLCEAELVELFKLRSEVKDLWDAHSKLLARFKPRTDQLQEYVGLLAQAGALLKRYQGIDARLDGKRKLLHALSQALYLNPRSRAGVSPAEKEPEPRPSTMSKILDE